MKLYHFPKTHTEALAEPRFKPGHAGCRVLPLQPCVRCCPQHPVLRGVESLSVSLGALEFCPILVSISGACRLQCRSEPSVLPHLPHPPSNPSFSHASQSQTVHQPPAPQPHLDPAGTIADFSLDSRGSLLSASKPPTPSVLLLTVRGDKVLTKSRNRQPKAPLSLPIAPKTKRKLFALGFATRLSWPVPSCSPAPADHSVSCLVPSPGLCCAPLCHCFLLEHSSPNSSTRPAPVTLGLSHWHLFLTFSFSVSSLCLFFSWRKQL